MMYYIPAITMTPETLDCKTDYSPSGTAMLLYAEKHILVD
jgi:hypothetical protein